MLSTARLAQRFGAYVARDNEFQRNARILQSVWRADRGYAAGDHNGAQLGSRLPMPWARDELANYMTDNIKDVVRLEVLDPVRSSGKAYAKPRVFNDLLSSQPLCFNLFGELHRDFNLATAVFNHLTRGRVGKVTGMEFEYSPGRQNPKFLSDSTAFDVYAEYVTPAGAAGFLGIEVKYHEDMRDAPARHRPRYDEVASAMDCFSASGMGRLRSKPLQQVWRDHMLAGSILLAGGYGDGLFAILYPKDNVHCHKVVREYKSCLTDDRSFTSWTLEGVIDALRQCTDQEWVGQVADRYVAFDKLRDLA